LKGLHDSSDRLASVSLAPGGQVEGNDSGHSVVFPMRAARLHLPLEIRGRKRPNLAHVGLAMMLASLFCFSVLHGLRLKRRARLEEQASMKRARLAQVTLHSIGEAVVRLDGDGRVRYMNPIAEAMSGLTTSAATGLALEDVLHLDLEGRITGANVHRLGDSYSNVTLRLANGQRRAMACTLSPIDGDRATRSGQVLVMRDVSREDELSRELSYQATHDPLTDLPNRREFERCLALAITSAHDTGSVHSVCYVDLDQFKLVNDTCGHAEGDRMLRQITGVVATEVRGIDTLARLGGDEFGILLNDCPVERALDIAERICRAVSGFRFISSGHAFELGASIGVVGIDGDSGTADEVQRAADLACYAAKDTGRNRVHLFQREDQVISRNHREMHWHVKIKEALETDRFVLHSQSIVPLHHEARVTGMHELLLRMLDEDGALVPPMAFLPAAERYGLMKTLDRAVIVRAFEHAASWQGKEGMHNINLSGQSLTDPQLAEFIVSSAARMGVRHDQICFEVTETSAISNLALASQLMQQLRQRGFRFALDDFGAGLSSFGYLKQLPVDFIKIDGQFVHDINNDAVARAMVTSIISVAKVLKIETVAEKVENAQTMHCLRALGVDYVQGFHIARPQPVDTTTELARTA
jgi:diguanylate cyclase (GGDEF)-like protein/PAS domain S-box-containing protein